MRRPPECLTKDKCDLRPLEEQPHDANTPTAASALEAFADIARDARAAAAEVIVSEERRAGASIVVNGRKFAIRGRTLIGRNGDVAAEMMRGDTTISREHAVIEYLEPAWTITHVAKSGAPLHVDGRSLSFGEAVGLESGRHLVILGDRFTLDIVIE